MPQHQHSSQGKLFIFFAVVLVLLTMIFSRWEEQQINPNQRPETHTSNGGISEVFLKQNRQGHYVVNGFINNQEVVFLLDTGATDVAVPEKVAERLGLKKGFKTRVSTANGVTTAYSTKIHSLTLGNIELFNVKATIISNFADDMILLGMAALRHIEFTQQGDQLILRQYR